MCTEVLKFPTRITRQGGVWCEPLKLYFPQIYLIPSRGPSPRTPDAPLSQFGFDFVLLPIKEGLRAPASALPLRQLSPLDTFSLIVRHH